MRWHIRSQLLLPLLLLLLGVLGLSVWMAFAAANHARRQIETRVRNVAQILSEGNFPLASNILLWVKQLSGADYLLVRKSGKPISTLDVEPERLLPAEEVSDDWRALRLGPPIRAGEQTYLCSGIHLRRGDNAGDILYIFYPESLWRDALWEAVWPFLVLAGSVGAASVALAIGLGQGLSRRIRELERRTRLIAGGDFSPMPLPRRHDEIRDLAQSVNEMAQRLARFQETTQRSERLRLLGQVGGGLAHQLRNGLTGVRLAVQLFVRECPEQTDTAALDVALRQLTLLETNLKRFLDLGREGDGRRERCSLPALVGEAVELLRPQCRHAGIELIWQPPADDRVLLGDSGQLGQLILNVLGNAVEAAGPGGTVQVILTEEKRLAPQPSVVVMEVHDSGPGPTPEVAERLFEPFVTGKPEGVGLGLAVARQAAEAHGGHISWGRKDGRTCFRIELPLPRELVPLSREG
ncbi:MAG TPA: HAMP domain-containing sensor histidine kinase [Gemmataceae bacterium]|jgi:signal transduction histidine kinase